MKLFKVVDWRNHAIGLDWIGLDEIGVNQMYVETHLLVRE